MTDSVVAPGSPPLDHCRRCGGEIGFRVQERPEPSWAEWVHYEVTDCCSQPEPMHPEPSLFTRLREKWTTP